jgi:hypothetical protein
MIRFNEMIKNMESMNSKQRIKYLKQEMEKIKEETEYLRNDINVKRRSKKR